MNDIFKNKVVTFSILGSEEVLQIKNPKFEVINEKTFIVGSIPKGATDNDWAVEKKCGILWSQVTDFIIFDSEDDYIKSIDKTD